MRRQSKKQAALISYVDLESRIPTAHSIRKVRQLVDRELIDLEPAFSEIYSIVGRPSITAGAITLSATSLDILYNPIRAIDDGALGLRPDVPLVCRVIYE